VSDNGGTSLDAETPPPSVYVPAGDRYARDDYRRCGRSGLQLPPISLGLWRNFGDDRPLGISRAILRRAFDLGITHFDMANNYGPPYGSAEINLGRIFAEDFARYRDEVVISTKAGYDMWPGPYGNWGSRSPLELHHRPGLRRRPVDDDLQTVRHERDDDRAALRWRD
jgi:L-glyceraldehyde 3-phosphate reductase